VLEVTFHDFTTEWEFRLGQKNRANNLMTGNLRSQKRFTFWKVVVGEFHKLSGSIHPYPFIFHLF